MSATSLQHKTIRPGSLMNYSYYHSARRPVPAARTAASRPRSAPVSRIWKRRLIMTAAVLAALIVLPILRSSTMPVLSDSATSNTPTITAPDNRAAAPAAAASNHCAGNSLDHLVLVNITDRHLWACQQSKAVYDSPVITGMEKYESTRTPAGTYKVYGKQTDQTLTGSDEAGSWSDPVKYWMPFLNNKYGTYGFHDATWRPNSEFGNVSPTASNASHGCVELPLSTSAWLYNWAPIGTTVTIKN